MRRREFITLIGGAAATWPLAARAQQPRVPVVGFLGAPSPAPYARYVAAIHQGLKEAGYIEGQNVRFEYRWAEGHYDRLPTLATDLVDHHVAVIVPIGGAPPTAVLVGSDTFFTSEPTLFVLLTARHAIPAIYPWRSHVDAGGLMSYGASLLDAYRQTGVYAGKILDGAKPADLLSFSRPNLNW
jgi:ABC-type uncharacterized transport system substrate-binding protein